MSQWKKELRRTMLEQRERLGAEERRVKSASLCSRIVDMLEGQGILRGQGQLLTFMPFGHEADIHPVAERCWAAGGSVAVPKTVPAQKKLELFTVRSLEELTPGLWGILEPDAEKGAVPADPAQLLAVLVPGVAFDRSGGRVGYGGGYYDRLLAGLEEQGIRPLRIAPAFEMQICEELALEAHDIRVDAVVTESGWYVTEGGGGGVGAFRGIQPF
ncbi:5-formyltetrahydrofolate cyclo-ligase [Paenibacillus sp. YN15]|uniref:5-formyltetrahydrofolate cyclo-ligase n=1 Tax=Paenibacillus sp. YN15 TaxID=1742774 RepID=UPI000DCEBEA5|nr:5-formyltetrahydrofolate cyclo-ligase [Paenibacillus sp. YN15]RAU93190.1 5-formyltetrahydrofolate cyclo-ligase [Paenibacillus sp. YN15]